jgi:hypothetical protein
MKTIIIYMVWIEKKIVASVRTIAFTAILFIECLLVNCVFNGPINENPLTFSSLDAQGDTLSVFPKLRLVFSSPIADSSVSVSFSPPFKSGYGAYLNPIRDTLTIEVMNMLSGNERYVLRVEGPVTANDGGVWDLSGDSIVFFTPSREQEPNDKKNCADTIVSVMYGCVSNVSDLDIFNCSREGIRAVYLQSLNCYDTFFIQDTSSDTWGVIGAMNGLDTIFLPDKTIQSLYIFVRSRIRGSEGNYKIGIIGKNP